MSTSTTNYNFVKPSINDPADITATNSNWDKIDTTLNGLTLNKFGSLGSNPIKKISDDTVENWIKLGMNGYAYFSTNVLNNQPSNNGFLLHYSEGANASQLFCVLGNGGKVWYRNGNTSAGWTQPFVSLSELTNANGVLPVAKGGTGGTTAEEARTNLNVVSIAELPNLYVWKKYNRSDFSILCIFRYDSIGTIKYSDSITISSDGVSLVNESELTVKGEGDDDLSVLKGKFCFNNQNILCFIHTNATFEKLYQEPIDSTSNTYIYAYEITKIQDSSLDSYIASKSKDTYPEMGEHTDGKLYLYNKRLGE